MDRYISGVDMITGLGVMEKDTDRRHVGWYKDDDTEKVIERLRKIARNAYTEGWHDGMKNNLSMQGSWKLSKTLQALKNNETNKNK